MKTPAFFALALALSAAPAFAAGPVNAAPKPAPAAAPQAPAPAVKRDKLFNAETFTLANGLQVVLIPNHRAPVATTMVWYKVGRTDEVAGKSGLAHFLEHLMFKGSQHVPPGELSKRVRAMGGHDNAFTTEDYTAFYQTVAVDHLADVMTMEADRMQSLLLPPDQFESERQVVLEERRMRTENDPRSYFMDQMRYALFPGHPYAIPVIGWKPEIEKLTLDDARAWHDKWYAPNNAILVVAGDITLAQLKPMVEKIYGGIPMKKIDRAALPPVSEFPGETRLTLNSKRVQQSQFVRMYRVPGSSENKQESLALDLLEEIMSGNSSTRLYQSLVVKQKLATSAGLGYQDGGRGTAIFVAEIVPADGVGLDKIETAYDVEMQNLIDHGVTAQELADAKTRLKDQSAFARDGISEPAHIIGEGLVTGESLDDIEYWPYDIDSVTAAQVQDVAKKYLGVATPEHSNYVTGTIIAAKHNPGEPEPDAVSMPQQEIR